MTHENAKVANIGKGIFFKRMVIASDRQSDSKQAENW